MTGFFDFDPGPERPKPEPRPAWGRLEAEPDRDARTLKMLGPGDPFGMGMRHDVCLTCGALIAEPFIELHVAFHDRYGHERVTWGAALDGIEAQKAADRRAEGEQ